MKTAADVPQYPGPGSAGGDAWSGTLTPARAADMPLRDLFALGCMMAHVNARQDYIPQPDGAKWYYNMADAMMKART